jgi:quinol-cytochrome oxidoreductase complex cytochrome b subunit
MTPTSHGTSAAIMYRRLLVALLFVLLFSLVSLLVPGVQASPQAQSTSTPTAQPTPTFDVRRLDKPVVPSDNTEQLQKGSIIYWGICMGCHGDRGQGLTEEWKDAYGTEDSDCWRSGCHGPDYSPESFLIPTDKIAPAIAGAGKLARFSNAQELHDFILVNMPWWNPGQLTDKEAWQVSAYILRLHKVMPGNFELNETTASAVAIQFAVPSPGNDRPAVFTLLGILALAAVGLITQDLRKNKPQSVQRPNFIQHLHPPTIPMAQARFRYTLGTGGLAVFMCLILLVTGILEMFYYIPVPEHAAVSVERITSLVPFGALIRNLHFWCAQALMIVVSIHLLRVVLTGAYARHRRLNYLIGLGMFVLVLLLDFTGYVLRWDEGIRWALVVGTNLLKTIPWIGDALYQIVVGGPEPGLSSLERFYTWHIFVLTFALIFLGAWHIFRVRRDGGVAVPPPNLRTDSARISRFDLLRREVLMIVITGVLLLFISVLVPAPIERPITGASIDIQNARAPWFFLWVQQLLTAGDAFVFGVAAPVLLLLGLGILPYVLPQAEDHEFGRWLPRGNRVAQVVVIVIALSITILTILAVLPTTQI